MSKVYVLHDSPSWVTPLGEAFDAIGLPHEFWYLNEGMVPLGSLPPDGIFYNRIGASAHTRGNPHAPELARLTLSWLEESGCRIINNNRALGMELSKLAQYQGLKKAGINTPDTIAAIGREPVRRAALNLAKYPLILKPNRGGKGLGVHLINDQDELESFLDSPEFHDPIDGVWLVQQYIQAPEPFIYRCEFVGGKFLYAMKVNTSEGFQLCPAESCSVRDMLREKFKHTEIFNNHPVIGQLENFLLASEIEVAGIELILDASGEVYVYDVNTNTNYNASAEKVAGISKGGMAAVANFLQTTLEETKAVAQPVNWRQPELQVAC